MEGRRAFSFLTFYFILEYSQLTMLWWFQVDSKWTQPYIYVYPFSPKQGKRSLILWSVSAFPKPCFWAVNFTGALSFQVGQVDEKGWSFPPARSVARVLTCLVMSDSLPGSSVLGIFQAKILEWIAISSTGGSSQPRDEPRLLGLLHWQVDSLPLCHLGNPQVR